MIKKIVRYRVVAALSFASIAFVVGGFLWAYFALRSSGAGPYILHFNDMEGITSVGGLADIVFMGVLGAAATVMNLFVALEFEARDRFLGKIVAGATLIFAVLLFIAFASILNVN